MTIWLATTLRDSLSAQQKVGPFMNSGAALAAARRTITGRHFGLPFADFVSGTTVCSLHRERRLEAATKCGAERRAAHRRPATPLGRDGVASKVDVFEVVRAVSRRYSNAKVTSNEGSLLYFYL